MTRRLRSRTRDLRRRSLAELSKTARISVGAFAWLLSAPTFLACTESRVETPARLAVRESDALLPARQRRLSNVEYERTVHEWLDVDVALADRLPPDVRQNGFSRNSEEPVAAAFATRLGSLASEVATLAVARPGARWTCTSDTLSCATSLVEREAPRALRRAPEPEEKARLVDLYVQAEALEAGSGARWLITALLQSPSFLYVSERGSPTTLPGRRRLDSFEIASALSYTIRGGPPDDELLDAARRNALAEPSARRDQARRLLAQSSTRHHFRRFVLEWLEVDQLERTAKVPDVATHYEDLKPRMLAETSAFVDEVMVHRGASVASLLDGGFSSVDPKLARFYDFDAWGPRVDSRRAGRVGLLQQASFLAAHAHPDSSSPVKRGDFVLRRLLCINLPRPQELDIEVSIPTPDHSLTTRERFSAHQANTSCRACHDSIDALGFTFESFDAAGKQRKLENGRTIDTKSHFEFGDLSGDFSDSVDLSRWLAGRSETRDCFDRHALRYFTAQSDRRVEASLTRWLGSLPAEKRGNLIETLVAFVGSDWFVLREEVE